jgi:hypothetical protein
MYEQEVFVAWSDGMSHPSADGDSVYLKSVCLFINTDGGYKVTRCSRPLVTLQRYNANEKKAVKWKLAVAMPPMARGTVKLKSFWLSGCRTVDQLVAKACWIAHSANVPLFIEK